MKSKSLAFSESYICSNKLQYSPRKNFMGLESGPYLNDGPSFCQIEKSKKKLQWKWALGSDTPICPPSKVHLLYQKEKLDCYLDDENFACLSTENDSTSGFSFEKYDFVSNHLKELDEFHGQKEMMPGRETRSLFLDWDFDVRGNKISSITSPPMEFGMDSTLPIALADGYWQSGNNRFDANELFPSSLLSYTSVSQSYSDSYYNHDCRLHSLEERKYLDTEQHHFPLTLPHCPNLTKDCNYDMCKDANILCSPQGHDWSMNMIFNARQHPGLEALLFSPGFDFGLRQHLLLTDYPREHQVASQPLQFPQKEDIRSHFVENEFTNWLNSNHKETLGHFPGDLLSIQDWSSLSLLMSLNQEKAFPLLLDKPSWASEAESDIDDCEGKHS